jgi:hypothetical protein
MTHTDATRIASILISRYGGIPLLQIVGLFQDARGTKRRIGVTGTPDIIALMPNGRFLGVEVKTGNAVQSREQHAFEAAIKARGGDFILARFIDPARGEVALVEALERLGYEHK